MHMVLLNGYLEWQSWMARAGGDLGHAMPSCHAHFPNRAGGDFGMPCLVALHTLLTK
jgi:hypothetical protein